MTEQFPQSIEAQLIGETFGTYKQVWTAMLELEAEYPQEAKNQRELFKEMPTPMVAAVSNLLSLMQPANGKSNVQPHEVSEVLVTMDNVVGFKTAMINLIAQHYGATILVTEHLYFTNKLVEEELKKPEDKREKAFRKLDLSKYMFPRDRVLSIRKMCAEICWEAAHAI